MARIFFFFRQSLFVVVLSTMIVAQAPDENKAAGVSAFEAGEYKEAIGFLKKAVSKNKGDHEAWTMLGTSYFKIDNSKEAIKALERAVSLAPKDELACSNLAMVYSTRSDTRARVIAERVLEINHANPVGHYVRSLMSYRAGNYKDAFESATVATRLDPSFTSAWFLLSRSLSATFLATRRGAVSSAVQVDLLQRALDALKKYSELTSDPDRVGLLEELKGLQWFIDFYSRPENVFPPADASSANIDPKVAETPLKIIWKPRPGYTEQARQNGIQGWVILLVGLESDGTVGPIVVLRSLDPGLDRRVVAAAKGITFTPPTRNGKPYPVIRQFEYGFSIY